MSNPIPPSPRAIQLHAVLGLARSALREASRGGLPWLAAAALAAALAAAGFLSQVALTDGAALQAAGAAALLRACAVFLVAVHVAASLRREADDKGLELVLALPLARATYYLGRLAGYAACAALLALAFSAPLLLWSPPGAVALWGLSLALEATLAAAAALFFASALGQLVSALAATAGFYVLARTIAAMQALAGGPLAGESLAERAAHRVVDAIAFLLPRLESVTRTEWLIYGAPAAAEYAAALAGLALYAALLVAAGLVDFHRAEL